MWHGCISPAGLLAGTSFVGLADRELPCHGAGRVFGLTRPRGHRTARDHCWPVHDKLPLQRLSHRLSLNELYRSYDVYRYAAQSEPAGG